MSPLCRYQRISPHSGIERGDSPHLKGASKSKKLLGKVGYIYITYYMTYTLPSSKPLLARHLFNIQCMP
jgi:hypothetical protein